MTFTQIINESLHYYHIIDEDDHIENGSIKMMNSSFTELFMTEINFTAKSFGLDDRLERGFNVNSLGDYVVISPFKKRRE